jgi:dTDP-glucose 4,6-dehydratase/UDP-glucose 4-epimerase
VRVLITGGAGFLGSHLARRLAADAHQVVVLDDFSRGRARRLDDIRCEVIPGDVRDPDAVTRAMHGCDTVAHLAFCQGTQTFYEEPRQVLDVGVRGMLNILTACEATGCGDLLLVSSSEAYQVATEVPTPETVPCSVPDVLNPRYSYGGGKIISELLASAWYRTGVLDRVTIARPHNCYGKDAGYEHVIPEMAVRVRRLMEEHPEGPVPFPIQGTGQETRAFCHVDDTIDALALLLESAEGIGIWHVGNPEEITIEMLVRLIGAHYNREMKVIPGSLPKGSPPRRCPDITKLRTLGYEPKIPLAQGLGPVLDWYRDHPR